MSSKDPPTDLLSGLAIPCPCCPLPSGYSLTGCEPSTGNSWLCIRAALCALLTAFRCPVFSQEGPSGDNEFLTLDVAL